MQLMKLRSGTKTPGWSLLSNKKNNLLFLVIFAVLYFLMKTPVWIFLTATILLVKILDNKKYYILAIANIICWLFTWKAFDYQLFEFATNTYSNSVAIATIKAIIIFFVLTAFYFFHKKSNKKLKTLFPGIVILIYITTMAVGAGFKRGQFHRRNGPIGTT